MCNNCRKQFVKSGIATDFREDAEDRKPDRKADADSNEDDASADETCQLRCPHCDQWIDVSFNVVSVSKA